MGTLSKLRRMVLRENVSVREAARRLRISRNTAAKWLNEPQMVEPRYPQRAPAPSLLDPYREQLANWLKTDSYRGKRDRCSVRAYFEAIRAMGFTGSKNLVYGFCSNWRQEQANAPRNAGFVPLSFELGEAFQFNGMDAPPITAPMCQSGSVDQPLNREDVHHEDYNCWH